MQRWIPVTLAATILGVAPAQGGADELFANPKPATEAQDEHRERPLGGAVVDYEAGVLAFLQNDGRYGAAGTEFDTDDTGQADNLFVASRLSLELTRGNHTLVLLYAPLDVTTRVTLDDDLRFRETLFEAGTLVDHRYLFDGYRASYLYDLRLSALSLQVGGSLQIRNANVAFTSVDGEQFANESDIGVVPALKVRLRYDGPAGAYAMLDADGLSTFGLAGDTEGGIYDVALSLGLPVTDFLDVFVRTRALGGGADVPDQEIENFAHFLSFTAGVRIALTRL